MRTRRRWPVLSIIMALAAANAGCMTAAKRNQDNDAIETSAGLRTRTRDPVPDATTTGRSRSASLTYPGGSPLAAPAGSIDIAPNGTVTMAMEDVDIATAAKAVLGDVLKADFAVDPRVQGRVTLKTAKPVPAAQALAMFETALMQNGAALAAGKNGYSVVPSDSAAAASVQPIRSAGGSDQAQGFGLRAVRLKNLSAAEMADILAPVAKDAVVRIDKERNVLVLQGSGPQFNAAMETIRTFDVDWLSNKSVGVFRLDNTSADAMTKALGTLLQNENIDATMAKFVALDSNNTIVAVAKTPDLLAAIRTWVARLDQAGGASQRMFTYEMRHSRASEAGPIVGGALGIPVVGGTTGSSRSPGTGANARTGAGSGQGPAGGGASSAGAMGQGLVASAAMPGAGGGLDPARAVLEEGLRRGDGTTGPPLPGGAAGAASAAQGARIVVDDTSNKLLVYASAAQFDRIREALRTVDVPHKQVLVEATFIEVTLNESLKYGAQYYIKNVLNGTRLVAKLTPNDDGSIAAPSPGGSLSLGVNSNVIIDALSGITKVSVISSPNLLVMNNQPARLIVGDQVPVTSQTRTDPYNTSNVQVSSVEFRDTGIIFDVTPHITSSGAVMLDILQEVSSVQDTTTKSASLTPTISQRRVTSSVVAANNETIVIGGLFSNERSRSRSGLPVISKVPVLGALFSETGNTSRKVELLVLISTRIVNDKVDARNVSRELTDRIRDLRLIDTRPVRSQKPISAKY